MAYNNSDTPYGDNSYGNNSYDPNNKPYVNQQYNGQTYSNQQYNGQQYGGQTYSNQQYNGQQYGGQTYSNQQYNGQQYGGQTYGNQSLGSSQQNDYINARTSLTAVSFADVMAKSFLYMFIALMITGITSLIVVSERYTLLDIFILNSSSSALLYVTVLSFVFLEIAVVAGAGQAMKHNKEVLSAVLFFTYSVLNGVMFSVIFIVYAPESVIEVFLMTSVLFGTMAIVGAKTKRDMTKAGNLLLMGLIGIIIVSVINIFIGAAVIDFVVSIVGIIIFLGITAYDVQKIKNIADNSRGYSANVIGLWGAMNLYLDFINLFVRLIRIFGRRR